MYRAPGAAHETIRGSLGEDLDRGLRRDRPHCRQQHRRRANPEPPRGHRDSERDGLERGTGEKEELARFHLRPKHEFTAEDTEDAEKTKNSYLRALSASSAPMR